MLKWLRALRGTHLARPPARTIPDGLWQQTLAQFPFLGRHGDAATNRLRDLAGRFLQSKEFHGAAGMEITDAVAVAIAAQACLPLLFIGGPYRGLEWYADFVGIVVHPGAVVAQRETVDEAGVVHRYEEVLSGEAMENGPVTLSWEDVADAGGSVAEGYNVVVHEFAHKIDMRDGTPDGCPPLPAGFMGARSAGAARKAWMASLQHAYEGFCDTLSMAERFGGAVPWLDPYAAHSIDEFFAVASEAYFVNRPAFQRDFPGLLPQFDAFFRPLPAPG